MSQSNPNAQPKAILITPQTLRRWPLPAPIRGGDKNARGRVLVVAGAPQMPGASVLAATAALRAGAGRLRIAVGRSIAPYVAIAVPESYVIALPETKSGGLALAAVDELVQSANRFDAVLIGPGMMDKAAITRLLGRLLPQLERPGLVIDALALVALRADETLLHGLAGRTVITPHAGEMAMILQEEKAAIEHDPQQTARDAAARLQTVVALKGRETFIAAPGADVYCNRAGNVGLATSGSGDTLAGIMVGLLARGATPQQAAVWATYLHGRAGDALARRIGPLGYLARELADEVPRLLAALAG